MEIVARGVRNTVGFDFHPQTKELWFTDNQRDWLSEDMPLDELNRLANPGKDTSAIPTAIRAMMTDPEFGWGKSCDDYVKPAALLGPHAAPLGMRFYTGKMFPAKYRGAIFIARHGPWNRTKKYADVSVAYVDANNKVTKVEPFLTGFVKDNDYLGRPVDVLVMPDGSLLVSDDHAGADLSRLVWQVRRLAGAEAARRSRRLRCSSRLWSVLAPAMPPRSRCRSKMAVCVACHGADRPVAKPGDPAHRRPAQAVRHVPAVLLSRGPPQEPGDEHRRQGHERRRPDGARPTTSPSCRRRSRRAAAARRGALSARRGAGGASASAASATTPTIPAASRCRAWPASARPIC